MVIAYESRQWETRGKPGFLGGGDNRMGFRFG